MKIMNQEQLKVQAFVKQKIATAKSQNEAARQLGMSGAHIINFRDGNWESISDKEFRRIAAMAGVGNNWKDYPTTNLLIGSGVLKSAQHHSRFMGLVGFTGSGKTHVLRIYSRKTAGSYYILADTEMNKKRFLGEVLRALGVRADYGGINTGQMLKAITEKLNSEHKPLLIIDDAGKLSDSILRLIQIIYDRTEGRAGIVLAGTEYLQEMIERKARRNTMGYREIRRRIGFWAEMMPLGKKDVGTICKDNGITDHKAILYIFKQVKDYGTLKNMIINALTLRDKTGAVINLELMQSINQQSFYYQ